MKYIVENKNNKKFLTGHYASPDNKYTNDIAKAHRFSAFELLLASTTVLRNKSNYVVYRDEDLILEKELKE